ncbi:MAG: hypothetical protein HY832_00525 [Candidatus Aenigmarchaeota archaeon]|nr:hypothetical protein [Candidatus Aenigmarchaeota archaeon]
MVTEEDLKKQLYDQMMMQQQQQVEAAIAEISAKILDRQARERLNNLKVIKPELAMQLQVYLAQLYKAGEIKNIITDAQLVVILKTIGKQKEFTIRRK